MFAQPDPLPDDLPVPIDDGAARHLPGRKLPPLSFVAIDGSQVRLTKVSDGRWVLFIYPSTGKPGEAVPKGWNEIPGARGCSQEVCSFRDLMTELSEHGAKRVLALSSDRTEYQQALVHLFQLPYSLISDPALSLAEALKLPTFEAFGKRWYKRLSMVVFGDTIEYAFYPIFPPNAHASEVLEWLRANPVRTLTKH